MHPRSGVKETAWQDLFELLARIRTCLGEVGKAIADGDSARVSSPIFLRLLDNAAQCLEGALRRISPGAAAEEQPPPAIAQVSLSGHTGAVSVGELLGFLSNLRRTGTLRIKTKEEVFHLRLEQGAIVYATGDNNPVSLRIGEILVRQGAISSGRLRRFLTLEHDGRKFLGEALVEARLVQEEQLRAALTHQVQEIFHRIHDAEHADFELVEGAARGQSRGVRLNVTQLLLESARRVDEAGREPLEPAA